MRLVDGAMNELSNTPNHLTWNLAYLALMRPLLTPVASVFRRYGRRTMSIDNEGRLLWVDLEVKQASSRIQRTRGTDDRVQLTDDRPGSPERRHHGVSASVLRDRQATQEVLRKLPQSQQAKILNL